jgi:SAM-dependent methyltransferase
VVKVNLSDSDFFHLYVKNKDWKPLQNHGYFDNTYVLREEDKDFPYQIISYLNLLDGIDTSNKHILDIGCGFGRGTYCLQKYFNCTITGTDIDKDFIKYASDSYNKVNFICDNFLDTKLKENTYDIIVSNCSSHFFYNNNNFYLNLTKLLKKEGSILITDICTKDSINILENKLAKFNFKIEQMVDISEQTIQSIEYDIDTLFNRFEENIIKPFYEIQMERLSFFKKNVTKQYKLRIKK